MKPIYTLDLETDPFIHGREPKPFAAGLYTGDRFYHTWGDDCIEQMRLIIEQLRPGIIYIHNGGKFDLWFLIHWLTKKKPITIIGGRIAKAYICTVYENKFHELRDSYSIMPYALKTYDKIEIDYQLFERETRDEHREEIVTYLQRDCTALHELCVDFIDTFGDNLTIGGTAMKYLKKMHTFECLDDNEDAAIRTPYYYGGRVQCFYRGIVKPKHGEKLYCYDMNQCYPKAMRDYEHPIGKPSETRTNEITARTFFVSAYGINHGAFPKRLDNGLSFTVERDTFNVSIHEFNAAIETGMFECIDVLQTIDFEQRGNFATFIDTYQNLMVKATLQGDSKKRNFYKYLRNSAYGKFAQDPDNYFDYVISDTHTNMNPDNESDGWEPCFIADFDAGYILWKRHTLNSNRYNVATGASITGAARSMMIRGIANALNPIYCDTDSLICEGLRNVEIHPTNLGAWKLEKTGDSIAIAGRKMYAMFDGDSCIKLASKGVHLGAQDILHVCRGNKVTWKNEAPSFNMKTRQVSFISRDVQMTA